MDHFWLTDEQFARIAALLSKDRPAMSTWATGV